MADQPTSLNPDDVGRIITLIYALVPDEQKHIWIYAAIRPSLFNQFRETQEAGKLSPPDIEYYGEVIAVGEGTVPPEEITQEVAKAFQTDPSEFFKPMPDPVGEINRKIKDLNKKKPGDKAE